VVWVGAGPLGANDGRVRLLFRDQAGLLVASGQPAEPADDERAADRAVHDALRTELASAGASFWPQLVAAVAAAGEPYDDPTVLDALWDLVWAGEVTNDSLAPLRARVGSGNRAPRVVRPARSTRGRRPDLGAVRATSPRHELRSLSRSGPPAGAGRWSLVGPLLEPAPTPTEVAHAQALQLLERYGVLTREAVLAEGVDGGFAAVYPVLKLLEDRGRVRRGYFVAGLGAAQFALPGAVDRLRAAREPTEPELAPVVLAAADPAQPYGAALAWPASDGHPSRSAGAFVVLVAGEPAAFLERGARSLSTFAGAADHPNWAEGLVTLVKNGRLRKIELGRIDGAPARESPVADQLRAVGFVDAYKGLTLRA
jgi:ATP-dependent Lhr-like helicase